ncbi:MAG: hypothetical protein SGI92_24125 [Bryobacteraceae bacterium]|nr:hypothetical protein [Bryobacteraceae bacterium]
MASFSVRGTILDGLDTPPSKIHADVPQRLHQQVLVDAQGNGYTAPFSATIEGDAHSQR